MAQGFSKSQPLDTDVTLSGNSDYISASQKAVKAYVDGIASTLAPLASPALTGNPTAPTATASDNDTSIATTAFVMAQRGDVPSGATLPASPYTNQLFLHTPTGRKVLMIYTNSAWYPLYSFGTMTLYVNYTSGTDAADKGTGTGTSAYKTLSYAWTQLPSIYYGNITINVSGETYSETLTAQGKTAGGAYTITIQGAETVSHTGTISSATNGSGATAGNIVDTVGGFTVDAYKGKLLKFGSTYRVIKSNTTDTLYVVGTLGSTPTGTYYIVEPATIVDGTTYSLQANDQILTCNMIKFAGASTTEIYTETPTSIITLINCSVEPTATSGVAGIQCTGGKINLARSVLKLSGNATLCQIDIGGKISTSLPFFWQSVGTKSGIGLAMSSGAVGNLNTVAIGLDNFATAISAGANAALSMTSTASYPYITNNTTGLSASTGAQITGTANNQYSGNTTNESATAASYGYID